METLIDKNFESAFVGAVVVTCMMIWVKLYSWICMNFKILEKFIWIDGNLMVFYITIIMQKLKYFIELQNKFRNNNIYYEKCFEVSLQ